MEKDLLFPNPLICKEISLRHPEGQDFYSEIQWSNTSLVSQEWSEYTIILCLRLISEKLYIHKEVNKPSPRALQLLAVDWYSCVLYQECKSQFLIVATSSSQWHLQNRQDFRSTGNNDTRVVNTLTCLTTLGFLSIFKGNKQSPLRHNIPDPPTDICLGRGRSGYISQEVFQMFLHWSWNQTKQTTSEIFRHLQIVLSKPSRQNICKSEVCKASDIINKAW